MCGWSAVPEHNLYSVFERIVHFLWLLKLLIQMQIHDLIWATDLVHDVVSGLFGYFNSWMIVQHQCILGFVI